MEIKALFLPCIGFDDESFYHWSCPFCNKRNITYDEDFREEGIECPHCNKIVKPCFDVGER